MRVGLMARRERDATELGRRGRRARWGWLATTLALGLALPLSAWANYRSVADAVDSLVRGQAEMLESAVRSGAFRAWEREHGDEPRRPDSRRPPPDSVRSENTSRDGGIQEVLDSLLAEHRAGGLLFAGMLVPDGEFVASAGQPAAEPFSVPDPQPGPTLVRIDDRVRSYFVEPQPGSFRNRPVLVLEFEPVVAEEMVARATRTLLLSALGAAILMLTALVFWRMSQRFEANQRRMEEQRRLSVLGEMSAVLAHEIRNPLASLKGHAQLLAERVGQSTPERRRAERVVSEATRLEALTSDLLDFTRSGPLEVRETNVPELVRSSAEEAAGDGDVRVELAGAPATWPLDERRVRQVLVNVIRNAVQASETEPAEVEAVQEEGSLVVDVRDRGPGLPAGEEARVFDPFYTTRTTGTGLGLSVARRIVELHGGTITATTRAGGGARFRIVMPRRR